MTGLVPAIPTLRTPAMRIEVTGTSPVTTRFAD